MGMWDLPKVSLQASCHCYRCQCKRISLCFILAQVHLNAVRNFNSVPGNFQYGSTVPNGTAAAAPKSILKKRSTDSNNSNSSRRAGRVNYALDMEEERGAAGRVRIRADIH